MKTKLFFAALLLALVGCQPKTEQEAVADNGCFGLSEQIQNVQAREKICLDGQWKSFVDQYETGYYDYRRKPMNEKGTFFADASYYANPTKLIEYDFGAADELRVPGDWNMQKPEFYLYEGTMWYRQQFDVTPKEGMRSFLYFGGASHESVVGVNGKVMGKHTGGFTPFNIEVTDQLKDGRNSVIVKVDNSRRLENVPTVNFDWWNYGGITRSVYLVNVPETFIRDYSVQLSADRTKIYGWLQLDGSQLEQNAEVCIPELNVRHTVKTGANGRADFEFEAQPTFWTPSNPKLYDVEIASETDKVADRIGFRTITTEGTKIILNGEPVFCKGICLHEESLDPAKGRATNAEDAKALLSLAKELGCNFVRLAHYPHNEFMVRTAEEMGLLVWDEIPVYWTIQWDNPNTYANAEHQLVQMISRDKNRANVIIWSVSNETPRGDLRLEFLNKLIAKAKEMDPTRLVSSAMEKDQVDRNNLTLLDELMHTSDVLSFNQYVGWYDGDSEKCDRVSWSFPVDKPVIITEFGGGAKYGYHGDVTHRFTEEYMNNLYVKNLQMLDRIDALAGATPWILKDFRSPKRFLPGIQDDFNRKGLVSEKGEKKMAFETYKAWRAE